MNKTIIGIQARLTSTRFPRKVLAEIAPGLTVLESCIRGCLDSGLPVVLLIPDTTDNDELYNLYRDDKRIRVFRGPEDDVLKRYVLMCEWAGLDDDNYVVRICGECPFADGEMIADMVRIARRLRLDYLSNVLERTYPKGLDVETFTQVFMHDHCLVDNADHEHITEVFRLERKMKTQFRISPWNAANYYNDGSKYPIDPGLRWCVDYPEDLDGIKAEYERRLLE